MDFDEYKRIVSERLETLTDKEQNQLAELAQTPVGQLIIRVLGNELLDLGTPEAEPTAPVRRGLAARTI
jgi:hypothetical protein